MEPLRCFLIAFAVAALICLFIYIVYHFTQENASPPIDHKCSSSLYKRHCWWGKDGMPKCECRLKNPFSGLF